MRQYGIFQDKKNSPPQGERKDMHTGSVKTLKNFYELERLYILFQTEAVSMKGIILPILYASTPRDSLWFTMLMIGGLYE